MQVVKRDGSKRPVCFDKITKRLAALAEMTVSVLETGALRVDPAAVTHKVAAGIYDGIHTRELDVLAAETAIGMLTVHPDYGALAARIAASNLQKETPATFSGSMLALRAQPKEATDEPASLLNPGVRGAIQRHGPALDAAIDDRLDFAYDYFGIKTLENSYLTRINGRVAERPQHMLMRVAVGIHADDIDAALETYRAMSRGLFIHATPTLFNAGMCDGQLSSCFLVPMKDDSIDGIYDTLKTCARISKHAGGIGFHVHNVRAKGSAIAGTNGSSNGLVPMLRVFNSTAQYVDQGGGKRKGSFACYLEPWHADVFDWLKLRCNHGAEEVRARDLFYALWIPDLFMKRVEADAAWTLMCPAECPGLADCHGSDFEELYASYERAGRGRRSVPARELWTAIMQSQIETGTPYMLYKDACNAKSNQQHLGTIKSSNLCTEIVEYTDTDEVAVCNIASIALSKFVTPDGSSVDHERLCETAKMVCRNLNKIIDATFYPVPEAARSNLRHRPIGIGVQGLADLFILLRLPFDSPGARVINREVFETIYYGALSASVELAASCGPYSTFAGSPASRGVLQFDMWGVQPTSGRWDWAGLKRSIQDIGLRNSLLVAPMPTASTAQILGNTECFEPYPSNIYARRVLRGEFVVVNKHLLKDLIARGLWCEGLKNKIVQRQGSVQGIAEIPSDLQALYKTVWEISMKTLIDMAADRGAFIDQSQSFNTFMEKPTVSRLSSMHFYGWKRGLKTGQYYLREKPAARAVQFTIDPVSTDEGDDECTACG